MRRAIREHSKEFFAVTLLLIAGLAVTFGILSQQQAIYPSWIPFLGEDRFELEAELSSAQAVTPGQGQTVNIAGIEVGDVSEVELEDGVAVVTMALREEYAPLVHPDASVLLRPRTPLQDMSLELDPGEAEGEIEEGTRIPVANTETNVNFDEILASLDADTRDYLQLLIEGAGSGLGGNGEQLSAGLRRFEPLARDLAAINGALAERRANVSRAITNFKLVSEALASDDARLGDFVSASDRALSSFADQQRNLRASLVELPGALRQTRLALESGRSFALEAGPASQALIPAARALGPALRETRPFFRRTTGPIREQIRPFARDVRRPIRSLSDAAKPLGETALSTTKALRELNLPLNALAYNPPGGEEGYLFWLAWANHNTNNIFSIQDAMGPMRRGIVLQSCGTAQLAEGLALNRPFLRTLQQVTNVAKSTDERVCPPFVFP